MHLSLFHLDQYRSFIRSVVAGHNLARRDSDHFRSPAFDKVTVMPLRDKTDFLAVAFAGNPKSKVLGDLANVGFS